MAVIINDFEVVVEPPHPQTNSQPETAMPAVQQKAPEALTPLSLEMVMRQRLQRQVRVRAD